MIGHSMTALKIVIGIALLVLAWVYLYRRQFVFRMNAWMRENVFNDHVVLFSGKRVAILLVVLGIVALFSGVRSVVSVQTVPPKIAAELIAQSRTHLMHKEYTQVIRRCRPIVRANPNSKEAWELLVAAWSAMGEKELAFNAAVNLARLDEGNQLAASVVARHSRP